MKHAIILSAFLLIGCAKEQPPVSSGLAKLDASFRKECPELPDIPPNDGDFDVRSAHHADVRNKYADCRDNNHALLKYAEAVSRK